jgi:hypothetical protein
MVLNGCRTASVIFLIFLQLKDSAQFNDTTYHFVNFSSTGSINQTNNTNAYLLNQALRFSIKKKKYSLNAFSGYNYGAQNRILTNNDFTASMDGNLYHGDSKLFYWGLLNYTSSYSLKINNQFQGGAGIAYRFIDSATAYFNLSDGILYETGDLFLDTLHDVYHTFRNSFRVMFKWAILDRLLINGSGFIQNSLSDGNDYILKSNLGISFKLRKWLSLTTAFTYNKFNRTSRENLLFNYGLAVEKYF